MSENDIKNAAEQAGKALGDSNEFVQAKGPGVADKIKQVLPYVGGALALIVLFALVF